MRNSLSCRFCMVVVLLSGTPCGGVGERTALAQQATPTRIAPTLCDALDNCVWTWSALGSWVGQTDITHDGVDAARIGEFTNALDANLLTTVTGPGTLTFWWKVSSTGANHDYLEFRIDGVLQHRVDGTVEPQPWEQQTYIIGSGSHELQWHYSKDGNWVQYDSAYVDEVQLIAPHDYPPTDPAALNTNAETDSGGDVNPQLTTDGAGNWVAVWESSDSLGGAIGTDEDILVCRSMDNGVTWTAPSALNTNADADSGDDENPQVSTDGAGNWVAVWESDDTLGGTIGSDSDILFSRSTNNGASWTAPAALNSNAATDSASDQDPQVTTDGTGIWVAAWSSWGTFGNDSDILFSRSTNNGASWTDPAALNTTAAADWPGEEDSVPQLTTDGLGNWVALWVYYEEFWDFMNFEWIWNSDIVFSRSNDNGASWTAPVRLSNYYLPYYRNNFEPQVTTNRSGNWVAVWESADTLGGTIGSDSDILFSRSTNNGTSWTAPAALNANAATDSGYYDYYPQVTTDEAGNWVAVWESSSFDTLGGTFGDRDILFSRSTNNGGSWTAPAALNSNAATDSGGDYDPQVTTDKAGNWVAVWESFDTLGGTIGNDGDILFTRFGIAIDGDGDDSDGDGLSDSDEVNVHGTDPNDADSDDDGLSDGEEVNTHNTDPLDSDSDGDNISDGSEVLLGTSPTDGLSVPINAYVYVSFAYTGLPELGNEAFPFNSFTEGLTVCAPGGVIHLIGATPAEVASSWTGRVTKPVRIVVTGGRVRIGVNGAGG